MQPLIRTGFPWITVSDVEAAQDGVGVVCVARIRRAITLRGHRDAGHFRAAIAHADFDRLIGFLCNIEAELCSSAESQVTFAPASQYWQQQAAEQKRDARP